MTDFLRPDYILNQIFNPASGSIQTFLRPDAILNMIYSPTGSGTGPGLAVNIYGLPTGSGVGDMTKAEYDVGNVGRVDNATQLNNGVTTYTVDNITTFSSSILSLEGSRVTTSSYDVMSASIQSRVHLIEDHYVGTGSFTSFTASYLLDSSSVSSRITLTEATSSDYKIASQSLYTISKNYVNTGSFTAFTASYLIDSASISSSIAQLVNSDLLDTAYLTYSGSQGTPSGTKGATLTAVGEWTVTQFGTLYFLDDYSGSMTITIPDAAASNEGKRMLFVKPRLVQSANNTTIKTVSGQQIAQSTTYTIYNADDRIEFISCNFGSNGVAQRKYRITMSSLNTNGIIEVGGANSLFTNLSQLPTYLTNYLTQETVVRLNPGTYYATESLVISASYPVHFLGYGTGETVIYASGSIPAGLPLFQISSSCDFSRIKFITTSDRLWTSSGENCFSFYENDLYCEIKDSVVDGFNDGVCNKSTSELWVFESDIQNCVKGIDTERSGSIAISECGLYNNGIAFRIVSGSNSSSYAMQNSTIIVDAGQTGVLIDSQSFSAAPYSFYMSDNQFTGTNSGSYISGFDFTQSFFGDIRLENNLGLRQYKPAGFLTFVNNGTSTTISVQGNYYKAAGTNTTATSTKFSVTKNRFTYLSKVPRVINKNYQ